MSTLAINTIERLTGGGSVPVQTVLQGTAKAWFNLNGTGTIAERDSFNISSYVDNGTGDYSVNFTTAFPSVNWMAAGSCVVAGTQWPLFAPFHNAGATHFPPTTTSFRVTGLAWTGSVFTATDTTIIASSLFGDPV